MIETGSTVVNRPLDVTSRQNKRNKRRVTHFSPAKFTQLLEILFFKFQNNIFYEIFRNHDSTVFHCACSNPIITD